MTTPVQALIDQAKEAIQNGRSQEAHQLLRKATRLDPKNHTAWLWMASVADTPQQALAYVRQAQKRQPDNPIVHEALAWAKGRLPVVKKAAAATAVAHVTAVVPPASSSNKRRTAFRGFVFLLLLIPLVWFGKLAWDDATDEVTPVQIASHNALASEFVAHSSDDALSFDLMKTAVSQSGTLEKETNLASIAVEETATTAPTPTLEPTSTPTPTPTDTAVPTSTNMPEPLPTGEPPPVLSEVEVAVPTDLPPASAIRPAGVGENERWIDVNLTTQTLVAYEGETAVLSSLISSGTWNHPTVTGQFRTWLKHESQTMNGYLLGYDYFLEDVPYVMYFYRDYAIHGTYWHNNFGTPMSHGCVNTPTENAGWLFNWAPLGTLVNVHY